MLDPSRACRSRRTGRSASRPRAWWRAITAARAIRWCCACCATPATSRSRRRWCRRSSRRAARPRSRSSCGRSVTSSRTTTRRAISSTRPASSSLEALVGSELDGVDTRGTIVSVLLETDDPNELVGALEAIGWLAAERRLPVLGGRARARRGARAPRRGRDGARPRGQGPHGARIPAPALGRARRRVGRPLRGPSGTRGECHLEARAPIDGYYARDRGSERAGERGHERAQARDAAALERGDRGRADDHAVGAGGAQSAHLRGARHAEAAQQRQLAGVRPHAREQPRAAARRRAPRARPSCRSPTPRRRSPGSCEHARAMRASRLVSETSCTRSMPLAAAAARSSSPSSGGTSATISPVGAGRRGVARRTRAIP